MCLHQPCARIWLRSLSVFGIACALSFDAASASAEVLRVGPGQTYSKPCDAIAAAKANDEIEIAASTYTDSCVISVAGLKLRGVDGRPKIDLSGSDHPAQYKGIYVVTADDVTIENLELAGAHISADNGENAAGIRLEAKGLTVRNCRIHDNQNGILGGTSGTLTIEYTEFFQNGKGDGCNTGGCTHNLYIAAIDTLYFRHNLSHDIANDTQDKGHLLKSRAKANYILYNRITGEAGPDSYEINLPNGGLAVLVGNVVQKGKNAGNSQLLSWGEEGNVHPDRRIFLVNNTFVNDFGSGMFISASGATLTAKNNLFVGKGTLSNAGTLSADNLSGIDPLFVDKATYDYHLMAGSPAIGKAIAPGSADQFSLVAAFEYVHPLATIPRGSVRDVGAHEFGTSLQPSSDGGAADASAENDDAGARDAGVTDAASAPGESEADGAAEATEDADTGDASTDDEEHGGRRSGCSVAAPRSARSGAVSSGARSAAQWLLLLAAVWFVRSRQRRAWFCSRADPRASTFCSRADRALRRFARARTRALRRGASSSSSPFC
jgi:hypothetical protein